MTNESDPVVESTAQMAATTMAELTRVVTETTLRSRHLLEVIEDSNRIVREQAAKIETINGRISEVNERVRFARDYVANAKTMIREHPTTIEMEPVLGDVLTELDKASEVLTPKN